MGFSLTDGLQKDISGLTNSAALVALNAIASSPSRDLPWDSKNSAVQSPFFHYIDIDPQRWDQMFPYRLIVIDSTKGNAVVGGTGEISVKVVTGTGQATLDFQQLGRSWIFTLPITPKQLTITDSYSINTSATLQGIIEEHNGVKFKLINAQGTMGVWPGRLSITSPPSSPNILQSVFGGTIEAAQNVATQFKSVFNAAITGTPFNKPVSKRPESQRDFSSTGYYQALALQQFLEQYAEAKKDPKNKGWRLVFDMPKQNQSLVVTPVQFLWQQNEQKPMEVAYNFQLKAWRRVDLKVGIKTSDASNMSITPGILQRILATVTAARNLASASLDLIGAVRSDLETPLDVLRQTSLFVKDLVGAAITAADLPFQLQRDYQSSIADSVNTYKDAIAAFNSDSKIKSALDAIKAGTKQSEGLTRDAVANGQLGANAAISQSIDPINNVLSQPERNFALMDNIPVHSMKLSQAQQDQVDQVVEDARSTTVDDLRQYRKVVLDLVLQLSNNFGAGDSYYNQIYGRPSPQTRIQPMTLDEFDILRTLYDVLQSYDVLTANSQIDDRTTQTSMEYVAGLADESGIAFTIPGSKILVPVPYGLTIEGIAARYLGDPQRWIEIVTLNSLRDPYIDESGFQLTLLSNASGRQITIASVDNLYVGQRVVISSSTQTPSPRRILGIDKLSDTSYLITLDGSPNLDSFIVQDKAYMQAYLPGTINSQQKIFIPSDLPAPQGDNISIPSSVASDPLIGLSKVDWLLTDSGDIATNNYGDFRLAAGMTNLIQALKIKIGTVQGTLIAHPDFGLGLKPGIMSSDVSAHDIFNKINKLIQQDTRFIGINSMQVNLTGPALSLSMGISIAGIQGVFPISFMLPS